MLEDVISIICGECKGKCCRHFPVYAKLKDGRYITHSEPRPEVNTILKLMNHDYKEERRDENGKNS